MPNDSWLPLFCLLGKLEEIEEELRYILKSAQPWLTDNHLDEYMTLFRGGPRRPSETKSVSDKVTRYNKYYRTLSEHTIRQLQTIYKWDTVMHGYRSHPLIHGSH